MQSLISGSDVQNWHHGSGASFILPSPTARPATSPTKFAASLSPPGASTTTPSIPFAAPLPSPGTFAGQPRAYLSHITYAPNGASDPKYGSAASP